MKKATFETLDKTMLEWFTQQCALGNPVNGVICAEKAKIFFEVLGLEGTFDASSRWLYRFKQRHGIRNLDIQGEVLSGDKDAVEKCLPKICYLNRYLMPMNRVFTGNACHRKHYCSKRKKVRLAISLVKRDCL